MSNGIIWLLAGNLVPQLKGFVELPLVVELLSECVDLFEHTNGAEVSPGPAFRYDGMV